MVGELPLPLLHPLLPCSTIPASKKKQLEMFNGSNVGIKENRFSLTISKSSCLLTNTTTIEKFWYMYFGPPTVQNTWHSGRGGQNFSMALVLVQRPRLSLHALHAHNGGRKYWNFQKCFNLVNWFQKVFEIAQLRVSQCSVAQEVFQKKSENISSNNICHQNHNI